MKVWTLKYFHRHGDDVTVYASEEAAIRSACDLIMQYNNEIHIPATRRAIVKLIALGAFEEAHKLWGEYQRETSGSPESIDIEKHDVIPLSELPKKTLRDGAKATLEELDTGKAEKVCPAENCGLLATTTEGTCTEHGGVQFEAEK